MTERHMIEERPRRGAAEGISGPGRRGGEPVLFWAERAPGFYLRATAISALLLSPTAFFMPLLFLVFLGLLGLSGWINARSFRFQVRAHTLTLRQSILLPRLCVPLAEIRAVEARQDPGGRLFGGAPGSGLLLITMRSGRMLVVPGLKDVAEAVSAIRTIQAGAGASAPAGGAGPGQGGGGGALPAG